MSAASARLRGTKGTLGIALVFILLATTACDDGLTGLPAAETSAYNADGSLFARGGVKGEKSEPGGGKNWIKTVGRKGTGSDTTSAGDTSVTPPPGDTTVTPPPGDTTVTPPPSSTVTSVASVIVSPASVSLVTGTSQHLAVRLYDGAGNELTGRAVTWSSSNSVVATVTSLGLVAALTSGSATVTVTSEGVSGTALVSVTAPVSDLIGTPVYPGESIQTKVNAASAGTSFIIKSGVHRRQTIVPKDGMKFLGEQGAVLDGEGVTQYAFDLRSAQRKNVTVRGLVIRNYVPMNSGGARGMLALMNGTGWIVEGNEIHGSTVSGIEIGPQTVLRGNRIHSNRYSGVGGWKAHGSLIENNEVYLNGSAPKEDASVEGRSGMKIVRTDNLTIRGNIVRNNYADGIWCDIDCRFVLIESNVVQNNSGRGIYYEISYDAVIKANLVEQNCLSCGPGIGNAPNWYTGIAVSTSSRVEIYGNTVRDNANGIQVRMDNRGSGAYGTYQLTDLYVHSNIIRMKSGTTGLVQSVSDNSYFTSRNNRFQWNTYQLGSLTGSQFLWMNGGRNWSNWVDYKQDTEGSAAVAP